MKLNVDREFSQHSDGLHRATIWLLVCMILCVTGCRPRRGFESRHGTGVRLVIISGGKESGCGATVLDLTRVNPIMVPGGMSLFISEDITVEPSTDQRRVKVIARQATKDCNVQDHEADAIELQRFASYTWELMPTDLIRFNGLTMDAKTLVDLGNKGLANAVNSHGGGQNGTIPVHAKRNVPFTEGKNGNTGQGTVYTVCPGDDLFLIAIRFRVSVGDLRAANDLPSMDVKVGQRLSIPVASDFNAE